MIYIKKIALILTPLIFFIFGSILLYKYITIPNKYIIILKPIIIFFLVSIALLSLTTFIYLIFFNNEKRKDLQKNNSNTKESLLLDDNPIQLNQQRIIPIKNMIKNHSFNNSFSMALIGKWGSGKSSYLETLEQELKSEYEIIFINVWQLENSKNITNELKKELDNIIFRYNKALWLTQLIRRLFIQDYFSIVSKYLTKTAIKSNFTFEPTLKESKENLRGILNQALNGKKIILLIDELDRINSPEEILNIFKIIHYVNDFENIFTITAMDMEQIEKRIDNIDYIHKIFNLKYLLPLIDKNEILRYYKTEIFNKSKEYIEEKEFDKILKTDSILAIISNYRVIKNSFNDTIVFVSALKEEHPTDWDKYISFKFIFILNLIKAVNFEFYSYIALNQKLFILIDFNKITDSKKKKDFLETEPKLEEISKHLDFETLLNLIKLFDEPISNKLSFSIYENHSIENYHITQILYDSFTKKPSSIKNHFSELEFKHELFIKNLLIEIKDDKKNQNIIFKEIMNILLSNENIIHESLINENIDFLKIISQKEFVKEKNEEIYFQLFKKNSDLSFIFIKHLLNRISYIFLEKNIKISEELFTKYLQSLTLNKHDINKHIEALLSAIRSPNSHAFNIHHDNTYLLKIIYNHFIIINDKNEFSKFFLESKILTDIEESIQTLSIEIDTFIIDELTYLISYNNEGEKETKSLGKKLKEELKKLRSTSNE